MPRIICVHGIGQQRKGEETLRKDWLPALKDGLTRAGAAWPSDAEVAWVFYGDLFRPRGKKSTGVPPLTAADVDDPREQELLMAWWRAAAAADRRIPAPEDATKARTPQWVQRGLNALSKSRFFAGVSERLFIWDLKQVTGYLHDPAIRREAWNRFARVIDRGTQVVIGHSLGSVVAYEALGNLTGDWTIGRLVTIGSPLGIRNVVFDQLLPAPRSEKGRWPPRVLGWSNIADKGDVVALTKELAPLFEPGWGPDPGCRGRQRRHRPRRPALPDGGGDRACHRRGTRRLTPPGSSSSRPGPPSTPAPTSSPRSGPTSRS